MTKKNNSQCVKWTRKLKICQYRFSIVSNRYSFTVWPKRNLVVPKNTSVYSIHLVVIFIHNWNIFVSWLFSRRKCWLQPTWSGNDNFGTMALCNSNSPANDLYKAFWYLNLFQVNSIPNDRNVYLDWILAVKMMIGD